MVHALRTEPDFRRFLASLEPEFFDAFTREG
jgi:hypothetical protein